MTSSSPRFEPDEAAIYDAERFYDLVVSEYPPELGRRVSAAEREKKSLFDAPLTYGEAAFAALAITFQKIKRFYGGLRARGGRFVDVGSGVGKAVFAAALLHEWDSCVGVEVLEELAAVSRTLLGRWRELAAADALPRAARGAALDFVDGDACVVDWGTGADFVFMNSTCFSDALMLRLATIADRMSAGAWAVTFTKRLPSHDWALLESQSYEQAWGSAATVFIHRKLASAAPAAALVGVTGGVGKFVQRDRKAEAAAAKKKLEDFRANSEATWIRKPAAPPTVDFTHIETRDPLEALMGPNYTSAEIALNFAPAKPKGEE